MVRRGWGRGWGCIALRGATRMFGKDSILLHCAYDTLLRQGSQLK